MAISFDKNRADIVAAWKDVLDDKSKTNWSLFGYEGQTNILKLIASGENGLDELTEDLNSGKILYAFVRVEDPKTGLKKFLLVNWQGEGAPVLRKGTCANHIHDVAKLLSGSHLTINARNEDDIDMERLLKKLSSVSSAYSFKEPRQEQTKTTPVGTNYTRIIPTKELNSSAMQDFWKKEEEEEKRRIAAEKEIKKQELLKLEEEQRSREEKEHREREKTVVSTTKLQSAHVPIKTSPQPLSPEKTGNSLNAGLTEADRMREDRKKEARELIGSRVGAAKAIFTQHTNESQLQTKSLAAPAKPARTSIAQRINEFNQVGKTVDEAKPTIVTSPPVNRPPAQIVEEENTNNVSTAPVITTGDIVEPEFCAASASDDADMDNDDHFSTIKRSPHIKSNSLQSPDETTSSSNATDTALFQDPEDEEELICPKVSVTVQQSQWTKTVAPAPELAGIDDFICQDSLKDVGLRAQALYDYQAADDSEISFDPGDLITHIDQIDEGWWQGLGPDGSYGLFPANYVEILN